MPASRLFAKLIPLLTITLLLFNLLAPVSIAFAQDADPPPEPPPAEEVAAEEQPAAEEEPVDEEQPIEEGQEPLPEDEAPPEEENSGEPAAEEAEQTNEPEAETDEEPAPEADATEEPTEEQPAEEPQDKNPEAEAGEEAGDDALGEENPIAEAVEALDEADAMLLDEEGEPLSMASQEAAEALAAPDPQFCPAGLSFGDAGCGASHANMADAIADALTAAGSGISGTIFVEAGSFNGFTLGGFTFGTSLTIQGNADNTGTTNFTGAGIANNTNTGLNLTFNDVTFDTGVFINDVTGDLSFNDVIANNAGGNGISVNQNGDVSLDNVTANNTGGTGADITTSSSGNTVTVTNSNFNGNTNIGLKVGIGKVVLDNINANNNSGSAGAHLNSLSIQVSNSTFNNNTASGAIGLEASGGVITLNEVTASGNDTTGILAVAAGNITLNNVTANNNGEGGAVLIIPNEIPFFNHSINVFNSNFDSNGNGASTPLATGLEIVTVHTVTLDNVSASNNNGYRAEGVSIVKYGAFGDHLKITNSSLDNNVGVDEATGLHIETNGSLTPGYAITLDNVSASGNNALNNPSIGAWINTGSTSVGSDRDTPINISNSNFDNNLGFGLFIFSQGDVNLENVSANGSFGSGVVVAFDSSNGPHNTSIVSSSMQNNGQYGIEIAGQGGDLTILSTDTSGNGLGAVNTSAVGNIFIGETDCNPGPGEDDDQRDGKHAPLDPKNTTTIVLDLYSHSVTFPPMNLLECEGFVRSLFFPSELPGELNAGDTFLRALKMRIEGCEIPADGLFTIGFNIPATEQDKQFAVLVWDGSTDSWVEIPGQMTEDGRYTVTWPTTGTFVLVTR